MERFNKIGEEDVGITEYIDSSNKGFKCVLKHRYSDFIVNEIDIDGNVVWVKTKDSNIQESIITKRGKRKLSSFIFESGTLEKKGIIGRRL